MSPHNLPPTATLADVRALDPERFDAAIHNAVTQAVADIGGPLVFAKILQDASRKSWSTQERAEALAA